MAKKNEQTKGNKEIGKKAKKIKEKIMNKVEDRIENAQTNDLETDQKTPPIIETETEEKLPINDIGTDDLVNALKIPMQDAKSEDEPVDVHSAVFDSDEPEIEDEEEIEEENLNDRYFNTDSEDPEDFDNSFFDDSKLMAEMGVEILDLALQTGAMAIAKDFENPTKYETSEYKKNKIKKPLQKLLEKRGAKVSPEVMFGVVVLIVYAPVFMTAINERRRKNKESQEPDIAEQIPAHIPEVRKQQAPPVQRPTAEPMVIPPDPPKKKGRPKGSKDSKKRKTSGYKGNKNAS
tara:strand:- start:875 stop:1747 length:873 start_codon:yes stop_codon:yes gene_type:complete